MHTLLQDLRYGIRMLAKSPGFTVVAVLTLALGIGANTAIFSVVNSVLLRPLPFKNSERLVWAWGKFNLSGQAAVSPPDFLEYRKQSRSFSHFGAYFVLDTSPSNLTTGEGTEQVRSTMVTADFLETLGVEPMLGRTIQEADEQATDPQVIVLSYGLWQGRFGGDPGVVGRTFQLGGSSVKVIGVMPAGFAYPPHAELWFPAPLLNTGMQVRQAHFLRPLGLLKPGVALAQAQSELDAIAGRLAQQFPDTNKRWSLSLEPMQDVIVGPVRPALLILLGAVAFVLLIACANVANLLLARNAARRKEMAIRAALGAGRARVVRQLLTESVLLAAAGGGLAVLLAMWGVGFLRSLGAGNLPRMEEVRISGAVLAFTALLSLSTGVIFGLVPALHAARENLQETLKEGGRTSAGGSRQGLRSALVVSELAISLILLVGAGLLLNSLWRVFHVNPGFDPHGVLSTQVVLSPAAYKDDQRSIEFFRQVAGKIQALPGVRAVGAVSELPLSQQYNDTFFTIVEHPPKNPEDKNDADIRVATPGYFEVMQIPLLRGRLLSDQDGPHAPRVVLVNEPFLREYFSGEEAVGKHLSIFGGEQGYNEFEIVGVVGGVRHFALRTPPRPEMYVPYAQAVSSQMNLVVRSAGDPTQLSSAVRDAVASVDKGEAIATPQAMEEIVATSTAGDRFNALLLGLFAVVALVLAAAGIYGVVSYSVSQRTREIGLRMALGAQPRDVLRLVVGHGMRLALAGVAIGVAGSFLLARLLASQLFGVTSNDPATFAAVSALLAGVALAACWIPARRATRVDPMIALRYE
jgi:putative ABC transport system permease protein